MKDVLRVSRFDMCRDGMSMFSSHAISVKTCSSWIDVFNIRINCVVSCVLLMRMSMGMGMGMGMGASLVVLLLGALERIRSSRRGSHQFVVYELT